MGKIEQQSVVDKVIDYLRRTALSRFFAKLVVLGVGLLGLSWVDFAFHLSARIPGAPDDVVALGSFVVGVLLIVTGIAGVVWVNYRAGRLAERQCAGALMGALRAVDAMFRDEAVARDAGYGNVEIKACIDSAKAYRKVAPKQFQGHPVIATIASGNIDASKKKPFFNIAREDIEDLNKALGEHYGIT